MLQSTEKNTYCITKSECEQAIANATEVNKETIKIWNTIIKKINKDFYFSSKEDLEQCLLDINKTYSSAYNMCGLLRATCKINELNLEIKNIVYSLYKDLRNKSGDEQLDNRLKMKQWSLEELIEIMRNIEMKDYKTMTNKLFIAMYTINPPLRNDYIDIKLIHENDSVNDTDNYIDLDNNTLNVYCTKSKQYKNTILCDELMDIIKQSLVILPRKYLFTKKNAEIFKTKNSLYLTIGNRLKKLFNDKDFSLNTFRHAYADWSFKQNARIRKQAAADMMHNKLSHIDY